MELAFILLILGILFLILDFLISFNRERLSNYKLYSNIALTYGFFSIIASYFIFIYNMLIRNYSYTYVYRFSSNDMDSLLRLTATWSSREGSYFLWAIFTLLLYVIIRLSFRKFSDKKVYQRTFQIMSLNTVALFILTIVGDPFKQEAIVNTNGLGLNPILTSFWNLIHPPILFLGYALFLIPFSISLARLSLKSPYFKDSPELVNFNRFIMTLAWLTIGLGVAIGGYWAYITLGWGGFWAWDPVETASLVPWLFATMFFHGSPVLKKMKINFGKEILATLPYISVIFAAFVTRSGLLFSVHAFEFSFANYILLAYLITIIITTVLISIKNGSYKLFFSIEEIKALKISDLSLYISYVIFLLGTIGITFGLFLPLIAAALPEPFSMKFIVDQQYFNIILGVFGLILIEASVFSSLNFFLTKNIKQIYLIPVIGVVFGALNAFFGLSIIKYTLKGTMFDMISLFLSPFRTTSNIANFIIPVLILSLLLLLISVIRYFKSPDIQKTIKLRKITQIGLHIGIVVALIGAVYSTNLTEINSVTVGIEQSSSISNDGKIELKLIGSHIERETLLFKEKANLTIQIIENGNILGQGTVNYDTYRLYGLVAGVLIVSLPLVDYYISPISLKINEDDGSIETVRFQVQILPLINLLWIGIVIITLVTIILMVVSFKLFKNSYKKSVNKRYLEIGKENKNLKKKFPFVT
ncbi:MAG: cytochrome c biogenesis protein CcsA [Candidatus Hodarchaeales archaeon]|jgi:cytochrome c-type biogenesis protein CcmF